VVGVVPVEDDAARLADQQYARRGVPWRVGEDDRGVEFAFGDPGQVDRRRSEHADLPGPGAQCGQQVDSEAIDDGGVRADGEVTHGDQRLGQVADRRGVDGVAPGIGAVAGGRGVGDVEEGQVDDGQDAAAGPYEGE
jgi:hypothetical protein